MADSFFTLGLLLITLGLLLIVVGRILRGLATLRPGLTIKRLLDAGAAYAIHGEFKNWHYNRSLEIASEYEEAQARLWQILQVYQRGRWSVLFSGFGRQVEKRFELDG